jgi:integrase
MAHIKEVVLPGSKQKRFKVHIKIQGSPRISKSFKRKTDAKAWAAKVETEIRDGEFNKASYKSRRILNELIDRYIQSEIPKSKAKVTKGVVESQLRWWKQELGSLRLSQIAPRMIAEKRDSLASEKIPKRYLRSDRDTRTPATVNHYLQNLSHAFNVAIKEWEWLTVNPCDNVSRLKKDRGRVRFLTDEERKSLLVATRNSGNEYLYPMVVISISCGCRKSELLNLKWEHVDFERKRLTFIETKNGSTRSVPLTGLAHKELGEVYAVSKAKDGLVFPSPNDPTRPIQFDNAWKAVLKRANLKNFRWHDLRHEAASQLAMSGASLFEISEVLGHRTLAMVKRYAHLTDLHSQNIVEKMNARIFSD